MARRFYAGGCGCAPAGMLSLLKRARRDQSKVRQTNVGNLVKRKAPALGRKIAKTLASEAKRVAPIVASLYAKRLAPAAEKVSLSTLAKDQRPRRDTLAAIIAELDVAGLGETISGQLETAMLAAFRRAAAIGTEQVGLDLTDDITKQVDAAAVAYAEKRGGELITDLAGTTDDDMRALLERAVSEGMSPDELSNAVEEMGAFGEARADAIARTELAFAHVAGNKEGWAQSGQVVGKKSILGDLHNIEDICDDAADAGEVGIDESFADDADDPPYHPNCVCDIEPVLGDESDDGSDDSSSDDGSDDAEKVDLGLLLAKRVDVDQAAHSAATSDLNLLRKPTEAQAKAGNYKKGHTRLAGFELTIENPAGSRRRPEWPPLSAHYGYVRGTEGADGDHVDVFAQPSTDEDWSGTVFVIDQFDADGTFDEHKCMLGYDDEAQAVRAYAANYPDGWKVGPVTSLSCDAFRDWLASGDTDRPLSEVD